MNTPTSRRTPNVARHHPADVDPDRSDRRDTVRIQGVWDHPQLVKLGALSIDTEDDLSRILDHVRPEEPSLAAAVSGMPEARALFEAALAKAVKADIHDVPFWITGGAASTWHRAQASSLQWVLEMLS